MRRFVTLKNKRVVYKKVYDVNFGNPLVAKLEIPAGTLCYMTSSKCRAAKAKVLKITYYQSKWSHQDSLGRVSGKHTYVPNDGEDIKVARAWWMRTFTYRVGKTVKPRKPFSMENETCASGIHFYRTFNEAACH